MLGRERLAVHLEGKQHLRRQRLGERDRGAEAERSAVRSALVAGGEGDVQARPRSAPAASRTAASGAPVHAALPIAPPRPGVAGDRAHAVQVGAAVARALHHRLHRPAREALAQLVHRELERRGDPAADAYAVAGLVQRRDVAVGADVEVRHGVTKDATSRSRVGSALYGCVE